MAWLQLFHFRSTDVGIGYRGTVPARRAVLMLIAAGLLAPGLWAQAQPIYLDCPPVAVRHSSDYMGIAGVVEFSEVLRTVQFFNGGPIGCNPDSEDGFDLYATAYDCAPHSADYWPQDWRVTLQELLRVIQIYNMGAYHADGGEDGFTPYRGSAVVLPEPEVSRSSNNSPVSLGRPGKIALAAGGILGKSPDITAYLHAGDRVAGIVSFLETDGDWVHYEYRPFEELRGSVDLVVDSISCEGVRVRQRFESMFDVNSIRPLARAVIKLDKGSWKYRITYGGSTNVALIKSRFSMEKSGSVNFTMTDPIESDGAYDVHLLELSGQGLVSVELARGASSNWAGNSDLGFVQANPAFLYANPPTIRMDRVQNSVEDWIDLEFIHAHYAPLSLDDFTWNYSGDAQFEPELWRDASNPAHYRVFINNGIGRGVADPTLRAGVATNDAGMPSPALQAERWAGVYDDGAMTLSLSVPNSSYRPGDIVTVHFTATLLRDDIMAVAGYLSLLDGLRYVRSGGGTPPAVAKPLEGGLVELAWIGWPSSTFQWTMDFEVPADAVNRLRVAAALEARIDNTTVYSAGRHVWLTPAAP